MRLSYLIPIRVSLKAALLNLVEIHMEQREQVNCPIFPKWTTTQGARDIEARFALLLKEFHGIECPKYVEQIASTCSMSLYLTVLTSKFKEND